MGFSINTCSLYNHNHLLAQSHTHLPNSLHFNPISKTPLRPSSILNISSHKHLKFTKFLSEKIATVLIGSFIFLGGFSNNRSLALALAKPVQTQTAENVVELDDDDDEVMSLKLLEGSPKDVAALKSVFNAKMKRGKTKEAVEYVERLIAIEPKEVEWRLLQALCYEMIGDYSKAKALFNNILKHKPLLLRALHGLAMVMHKNHEGPAVFEMLNSALEIAHQKKKVTDERNIRILIAQMHVVKGELDDALKQFKDLIDENPRDFRPYLCQGIIYSLLDKKEEAEEQFLTYQSLVPEEFPQRGFLEDVVLAAKTEIRQKNKNKNNNKNKELKPDFLYRK
ncbi:protein SLOW GREEN 1, chloroplastic-like [Bidens hawaiensis]|uniref:protein SLOW GREEN 1, chloroplastic-like n=1 Tax=Bidens hawaiensis TaxID=980011 RepID=UPI00404AAA87